MIVKRKVGEGKSPKNPSANVNSREFLDWYYGDRKTQPPAAGKNPEIGKEPSKKPDTSPFRYSSKNEYEEYPESDNVKKALENLTSHGLKAPGPYVSPWQNELDAAMQKILNREKFEYDAEGDALYQQYRDAAIKHGKLAMADTMGKASAMTGGYGNSYAATVGNQAYQQELGELNEIIPQLQKMAFDKYRTEGEELKDQYAILGQRENDSYGKYMDKVNQYNREHDRLYDIYDNERRFASSTTAGNPSAESSASGMITDPDEIDRWSGAISAATTYDKAMYYAERLAEIDEGLAFQLMKEWEYSHKGTPANGVQPGRRPLSEHQGK